jgi:hypothetical protein
MRAASVKLDQRMYPKVVALVMFGDRGMREMNITQFPPELQAKLFENCAPRDPVSQHLSLSFEKRLISCFLGMQWCRHRREAASDI